MEANPTERAIAKGFSQLGRQPSPEEAAKAAPYQSEVFFDSYYRSLNEAITDRGTIGTFITELDSRFHYNAMENAIIRGVARLESLPRGRAVRAWEYMRRRQRLRSLDIGSGAGHWINFFRDVLYVTEVVGCEIAPPVLDHLRSRFAAIPDVRILHHNLSDGALPQQIVADGFDYISAIGVMFHIVDDGSWERAIRHLGEATKPGGLLFFGGEFGTATRNVQFHKIDRFDSFEALRDAGATPGYRVNKKVRSLADWDRAAARCGLVIVDLIRSESDWAIMTPENDLLILQRPGETG